MVHFLKTCMAILRPKVYGSSIWKLAFPKKALGRDGFSLFEWLLTIKYKYAYAYDIKKLLNLWYLFS